MVLCQISSLLRYLPNPNIECLTLLRETEDSQVSFVLEGKRNSTYWWHKYFFKEFSLKTSWNILFMHFPLKKRKPVGLVLGQESGLNFSLFCLHSFDTIISHINFENKHLQRVGKINSIQEFLRTIVLANDVMNSQQGVLFLAQTTSRKDDFGMGKAG